MSFKNEEYIVIQGWMINELNLKGNDLLVYALIYRYSQDGVHKFYGSLQYLADWTNSTISGIQNNLKNLVDSKFIFKGKLGDTKSSRCEYWVNTSILSCRKNMQLSCNDMQLSCNNNTIKNNLFISKDINNNQLENISTSFTETAQSYFEKNRTSRSFKVLSFWLTLYIDDTDIRDNLKTWLSVMYNNKKIANLECLKNKVDFLDENLKTKEEKIAVIKDATDKLWFTFQYSVDRIRKSNYNIRVSDITNDNSNIELSDEVF